MAVSATADGDSIEISLDGFELVANLLEELARHDAQRSLDRAMQQACDTFAQGVLLPAVQSEAPVASGKLRGALDWWQVSRRQGAAAAVGIPEFYFKDFQGDLYYAGFQEFGWRRGRAPARALGTDSRPQVPPDAFLRRTLYRHESAFEQHVAQHLEQWVRRTRAL